MTDTEEQTTTIPHAELVVTLHVPVRLSHQAIEDADLSPKTISGNQLATLLREYGDVLPDAIADHLSDIPALDVHYEGDGEHEPRGPVSTIRPQDGLYTLPVPSMLDRVDLSSGASVAEAPVMALTVEQARGALWALKKAWSLSSMHRSQREELVALISEAEWLCCAVPALHFFKPSDADAAACRLCGRPETGHDTPKRG